MTTILLAINLFMACGETKAKSCGEKHVLQECDASGNCTVLEDCAAKSQICHDMGAQSHCMPADQSHNHDTEDSATHSDTAEHHSDTAEQHDSGM